MKVPGEEDWVSANRDKYGWFELCKLLVGREWL